MVTHGKIAIKTSGFFLSDKTITECCEDVDDTVTWPLAAVVNNWMHSYNALPIIVVYSKG
jgi:hypothetical protein